MKKVTTKVIMLMLVIPLLLIFTMATTIDMTSIMVDIPVTSVQFEGDETIFVDVTSKENFVQLSTIVTPKEATNKKVTYTLESVDNDTVVANISDDGIVSPISVGTVKVIATADGGRQDSININFYSSKVNSVNQVNEIINVDVGESVYILPNVDYNVLPAGNVDSITYSTESNKVKVDKYTGEVTGLFTGEAIVSASIPGIKYDNTSKKFVDTIYYLDFVVKVNSDTEQQIFSFAGGINETEAIINLGSKTILFEYLGYDTLGELSYEIDDNDEEYIESVDFQYFDNSEGGIVITLKSGAPEKDYVFNVMAESTKLGKLTIKKQDPTIRLSVNKTTFAKSNVNVVFGSVVEGLEEGYVVRYDSSNSNVFSVNAKDNECIGKAKNEGISYIKAILYLNGVEIAASEEVKFTVVTPYISLGISESAKTHGLENRFALGKYKYLNNEVVDDSYTLSVKAITADGTDSEINYSKLLWKSSDTNVATVDSNGLVKVVSNGLVTISVESVYNEVLQTSVKSTFEIECRENGLNVYSYTDLMYANNVGYETVLMENVMLGDGINADNYRDYLSNVATKEMVTTADKSYYDDNNKSDEAKIRYCVEFTSNVYGNGYYIDANNITRAIDKYNYSIFNGPLNLIALSYDNNSSNNAKVKAQDNIVFLVRKDGISINNVELKGCSDSSLIEANQTNLGKLNNCGTVLEVVGDNISLKYSRVNNGRTVVRIYGKAHESDRSKITASPDNYKIETYIGNSILSYAREFILKVGSNQNIKNDSIYNDTLALPIAAPEKYEHAAPSFKNESGSSYSINSERDEYFIQNYLMTDITLENSIFNATGLFCIGFDTQFAGLALHGYDYGSYKFSQMGWQRVAGTSYPARIKMQGDVRFYDWKEVNSIDSSTLVEGDTSLLETIGLDLNVSNLLNKFNISNPDNKVIYTYEGKDYINGAIVFYGGGKNYSWVDTSEVNSEFNALDTFSVPVSYFSDRPNLIYYAAGKEDFFFMTYNNESNLNYLKQQNDLIDGTAYSWIVRK